MANPARIFNTEAEAKRYQRAMRNALSLPSKGRNVGKGPHVVIPDVYAPGAPGWTDEAVAIEKHPTRAQWAVPDSSRVRSLDNKTIDDGSGGTVKLDPADVVARDATWDFPLPGQRPATRSSG